MMALDTNLPSIFYTPYGSSKKLVYRSTVLSRATTKCEHVTATYTPQKLFPQSEQRYDNKLWVNQTIERECSNHTQTIYADDF